MEPEPSSLWWTSTCATEEKSDMILGTSMGCYKFSFEDTFKILERTPNRQGKSCDAEEERMQSANKAFWKDSVIYKRKDVPWKVSVNVWWTTCMLSLPLEVKIGRGLSRQWKKKDGTLRR